MVPGESDLVNQVGQVAPPPTLMVGDIPLRPGTSHALGDRNPVPQRAGCPRQYAGVLTGNDCFRCLWSVQFWRGLVWLVVRVWTSATGRLTVLVVVMAGRVPLLPSLPE